MATTLLHIAAAVKGTPSLNVRPAASLADRRKRRPGAGGRAQSYVSGGAPTAAAAATSSPGGVASTPGGISGKGFTRQQLRRWRQWIVALPPKVPLAWAHCGDAGKALLPLGDEGIALEAAAVQQLMLKSWPQVVLPSMPAMKASASAGGGLSGMRYPSFPYALWPDRHL